MIYVGLLPVKAAADDSSMLAAAIKAWGFILSIMGLITTAVIMTTTSGIVRGIQSILGMGNSHAKMDTGVLLFFSWFVVFILCLLSGLVTVGFGEIVQAAYKYNRERR